MANLFLNLVAPAGDGVGAAVDTSAMGKTRTITVQDAFRGVVTVQFSCDGGVTFSDLISFTTPGKKTIDVAAQFMRVRRSGVPNVNPGLPNVDVGSNDIGGLYLNVPGITAGNGVSPALDVSALGTFNTVCVGGPFRGITTLEISEDGIDFISCMTFGNPDFQSKAFVAQFVRIRRSGVPNVNPGLPVVDIGAINDATAGGGGGGGSGDPVSECFIYQPGGGGTGPAVFASWADLITALTTARTTAGGSGCFSILFDDTVTSPAVIPAGGPYDMTDVKWFGRNDDFLTFVNIADGASFINLRQLENNLSVTNLNTVSPADSSLASGDLIVIDLASVVQTVAGGAPFWSGSALGGGDTVLVFVNRFASVGFADVGPVFDFPVAGTVLFLATGTGVSLPISSGVLTGAVGAVLSTAVQSMRAYPDAAAFAGWLGTVSAPRLDGPASLLPNPFQAAASAAPVSAEFFQWLRLDSSGGAVAQTLPDISSTVVNGPGSMLAVSEETGSAGLTVAPAAGDTIDGSTAAKDVPPGGGFLLMSDGVSSWKTISAFNFSAPRTTFVFQPGGTAQDNVYTDWGQLVAAIGQVAGEKLLFFDDSFTTPIVIPAGGPYDMEGVTWTGQGVVGSGADTPKVNVDVAAGATFTNLKLFKGNLFVTNLGVPAPVALSAGDVILLRDAVTIASPAAGPFFSGSGLLAAEFSFFFMEVASELGDGTNPTVSMPVAGTILGFAMGTGATVFPDAISSVVGSVIMPQFLTLSADIESPQSGVLGTVTVGVDTSVRRRPTATFAGPGTAPDADVGDLSRNDPTGGAIAVPLPAITPFNIGQEIVVKNVSASTTAITVTPAGADTIDGSATFVIATGFASITVASDGVSNWEVI